MRGVARRRRGARRRIGRARAPSAVKAAGLALLAACVPVAAHAVSGMETGIAIALATAAAVATSRPLACAALAGAGASLRPEMAPWAIVLASLAALGAPRASGSPWGRAAAAAAIAAFPFAACAAVRVAAFGRPAPLAVLAKPSDLSHGLAYAAAGVVVTVTPILAASPWAIARAPRAARAVAIAAAVHVLAVIAVGGDWMPYARLFAPIAPSLVYAFVLAAPYASRIATGLRVAFAAAAAALVVARAAPAGRHVGADRAALIDRARPLLGASRGVASVDVGWPSAVTEAPIVDLAGLTDPAIAALPGGHTSKRVDPAMLLSYAPEHLLLYVDGGAHDPSRWREGPFVRAVEARLAASDLVARHYGAIAYLPLHGDAGYFVLREAR